MSGKMGLRIKWLGCACFEMDFGGLTVVNDPWITNNEGVDLDWTAVEKCDMITLTHSHHDHIMDIPELSEKFGSKLLCGQFTALSMIKWVDISPMKVYPMNPGLELDFDAVKIKALFGRHTTLAGGQGLGALMELLTRRKIVAESKELTELALLGSFEYINFLYTMPNGTKILIWGNELTPEQKNIMREIKPDIAILQMTKNSPADTADICIEMGCKVVIPHHFDYPKNYMHLIDGLKEEFEKRDTDVKCIVPNYNEWIEL